MATKANVDQQAFNQAAILPFQLRLRDFEMAMQDVYDFFYDVNQFLIGRGLERLDDMLRPANMSGMISDMLTSALAKHSRVLVANKYHNGHPDLIVRGYYKNDSEKSGTEGVEVKSTRKKGGAVDTHGARRQHMCVFVYEVDNKSEPAVARKPMQFTEVYIGAVEETDFRRNDRGILGTRTATLGGEAIKKFRENWIYRL